MIFDGLVGTWFGGTRWFYPAWTLSVELYASYWVYRIAEVAKEFRGRFYIYLGAIMFVQAVSIGGLLQYTGVGLMREESCLPFFIIGVAFADMETSEYRPFDKLRKLSLWWKVPLNTILFALFAIYGASANEESIHCYTDYDEQCPFFKIVTFDNFI